MTQSEIICPCRKDQKFYKDCCKLIHDDIFHAKNAEQLMRSRYSAFVLCNGEYLVKSHSVLFNDPSTIHNTIRWARSVAWNRLEIISITGGKENDIEGTVEFKAFFKEKNKLKYIHENSLFKKENFHWVYVNEI